ncbi:hypothetical protein CKQ90_35665, partial [Klebsiella pneumoniae]
GNMSGFCVGEPWNARAINDRIGFTAATSQDIWPEHPEKVLGNMSGFCVGEPWNARAINDRIGFTAATSQDIWP